MSTVVDSLIRKFKILAQFGGNLCGWDRIELKDLVVRIAKLEKNVLELLGKGGRRSIVCGTGSYRAHFS